MERSSTCESNFHGFYCAAKVDGIPYPGSRTVTDPFQSYNMNPSDILSAPQTNSQRHLKW